MVQSLEAYLKFFPDLVLPGIQVPNLNLMIAIKFFLFKFGFHTLRSLIFYNGLAGGSVYRFSTKPRVAIVLKL